MTGVRRRPTSWHEFLFRALLHKYTRILVVLVAALGVFSRLTGAGYPWWLWLPATILAAAAGLWLWVLLSYAYQKATYPHRAAEFKALRRGRGD